MEYTDQLQLPVQYRRASFGKRVLAWLVDIAITGVIGFLISLAVYSTGLYDVRNINAAELAELQETYAAMGIERSMATDIFVIISAWGLAATIISIALSLLELFMGTSIGKMSVGLVIAHADGRRGDTQLWTRRWNIKNAGSLLAALALIPVLGFITGVASLLGFIILVGCLFALGHERLALHDRLSQSAVFPKENIQ